jgi:hypothetical protein
MDRFILRLFDMRNSLLLCKQFLFWFLLFGFLSFLDFIFNFDFLIDVLIYVFYMCWCLFLLGVSLSCIEHPKGEHCLCICLFYFGFTRCRIHCADFYLFYFFRSTLSRIPPSRLGSSYRKFRLCVWFGWSLDFNNKDYFINYTYYCTYYYII